jgi:hypothetical protein
MTKTLDSTAVYAYTTLISMIVCVPIALVAEGPALQGAAAAAIAKVGMLCAQRRQQHFLQHSFSPVRKWPTQAC